MSRPLAQPVSSLRCAGVWLAMSGLAVTLLVWLAPQLAGAAVTIRSGQAGGTSFDELLASVAAVLLTGCVLWLWLVGSITAAAACRGTLTDHPVRGCPASVQRLVLATCGITLAGSLTGAAHAVPTTIHEDSAPAPSARVLDGLPLPDRATSGRPLPRADRPRVDRPRAGRVRSEPTSPSRQTHTVRPGDTLWSVARSTLPDPASDASIDRRWRQIHAANRARVGADPDLIHPGVHLRLSGAGEE
ncbi:LysM peptidoglycan-binding domain-containing protein [Nocardioides sp.]|uniref:LysM peptidoglycan-binding domain-containing protein n=1 Tax=Nocardioides sp. TaxID=35761 RepID=UPI00273667E3|nr:LysM peptidoglycan-binding domain-containing protein [Nocardioides sp.]MDP3892979.1 LysM peptidoglycan-binding domain-containing protein [Nocardioides sp.]